MDNNNEKRIKLTFNKKVISISFLALALFMLLAVSYAYFTATVTGNESAKKTTLTTASMGLRLDGTKITELDNATPGTSHSITFTVTNTGNAETEYDLDIINVINTFATKSDLVYTIESDNGGGATTKEEIAPSESGHLIEKIKIGVGITQTYTLTLTFKETHSNQNDNQGKIFSGKIQINNTQNELAGGIIANYEIQTVQPDFSFGSPLRRCSDIHYNHDYERWECQVDWVEDKNGSGLLAASDNDGTSYYFRGDVDNNNVTFANKKWKIIRINGDGTIRLILNEAGLSDAVSFNNFNENKAAGYTFDNEHACTQENPCESDYQNNDFVSNYGDKSTKDSTVKKALESWYKDNLASYDKYIALSTYCNDTSIITTYSSYGGSGRISGTNHQPILTCPNPTDYQSTKTHNYGGVYKLKIGLVTSDELVMAGSQIGCDDLTVRGIETQGNYLSNMNKGEVYAGYAITMTPSSGGSFDLSPGSFVGACIDTSSGNPANMSYYADPVINLKADVEFTGTGTASDPYVVSS